MSNPRHPAMPFCTTTARPVTKFRPRISPNPQNQTAAPATPASPQHTPALHPCQSLAIRSEKTTAPFEPGHGTNSIPGPRGHSPVQGTQPCSGDTSPAHIAPKDRTHCTNTTHNGCTDSRHSPPRGMAPRDGPDAMISPDVVPGDTATLRGNKPCPGDTLPAHNSPRTESTAQTLNTMAAPTAVTDRRRRMAPMAMISPDAPRSPGTQPHSEHTATLRAHSHTQSTQPHSGTHSHFGDTATLRRHTLPAPNAPHPA